jgi:hypothetical protein
MSLFRCNNRVGMCAIRVFDEVDIPFTQLAPTGSGDWLMDLIIDSYAFIGVLTAC